MSKPIKKILMPLLFMLLSGLIALGFQNLMRIDQKYAFVYLTLLAWTGFYFTSTRHEKLKSLERVVNFKNHILDTLLKVNSIFMNMDEEEGHYDFILTATVEIIPKASRGSFLILNPLTGRYEFKACHGYDLEALQRVSFKLEETFLFQNAGGDYDHPVITKNIKAFDKDHLPQNVSEDIELAGGYQIQEAISAPIIIDGQIIGILNIDSEETGAFDALDKQLMHFFSTQIAMALKQKHLVDETIQLSKFDKLTGIYNRNHFEKIFNAHRSRSLEHMESYALVLCDLNNLKQINDSYGHTAGDQILIAFAKKIQGAIRESDVFSRIGGDEFVILLRDIDARRAEAKMQEIYQDFKGLTVNYHGHELPLSFSYGIALSPDDSMVYDVLIKIADERMYTFKSTYKTSIETP